MVRLGLLACGGLGLWAILLQADPPGSDSANTLKNTLLVQRAMEQARYLLHEKHDARQAVVVLEEHLARINGNPTYLLLLRDAYRAHVKDLLLSSQGAQAGKYLERLAILDRDAANDPALRPAAATPAKKPSSPTPAKPIPTPAALASQPYVPPGQGPKTNPPSVVRAKVEEDPFDLAYRRNPGEDRKKQAQKLLGQAEAEFNNNRYGQARLLFEQVHQADPNVLSASRDRWAYCKLNYVVDQLKQANAGAVDLPALEQEVRVALAMAPSLGSTANWLLKEIELRRNAPAPAPAIAAAAATSVRHLGASAQGWQVAETAHFRVYHKQSRAFVEKVAGVAEQTRQAMYRKWFGQDNVEWKGKCDLYLHATGQDYSRATGVPSQSPGHSRIESDAGGRVIARRLDLRCDVPGLLDGVLPHETTHVVLAGQFGSHPVPRWADEGMAVLTEPAEKIELHRRNLVRCRRDGQVFTVRELMRLENYPQPNRIAAFYAQSVVLVEFLSRQRGPQVFAAFLRDGLHTGYEAALQKHYGVRDFNDLQNRWNQHVLAEVNRLQPGIAGR
jgi:hypothetical protein